MSKAIEKTMYFIGVILSIWLALSYIEILQKNVCGGSTYSDYNIITNALYYFKIVW